MSENENENENENESESELRYHFSSLFPHLLNYLLIFFLVCPVNQTSLKTGSVVCGMLFSNFCLSLSQKKKKKYCLIEKLLLT